MEEELIQKVFLPCSKESFLGSLSGKDKPYFSSRENSLCVLNELGLNIETNTKRFLREMEEKKKRRVELEFLEKKASDPLYQSLYLLANNKVDCVVAGCQYTTKEVIKSGLDTLERKNKGGLISSSTLMVREGRKPFKAFFSDCGSIVSPNAEELATLTEATLESWHGISFLFPEKRASIAFLSFASHSSAYAPCVEKILKAKEIFSKKNKGILVDGPLQFDAAFDLDIREQKLEVNPLGHHKVNIYIFPDINSGNIAYKIAQRLGGCSSYGPLLQGFSKPFSDLSRGASVDEIISCVCLKLLSKTH